MRVNIYAEEMTDRIEIISKTIEGHTFTGLRFYLELPVTMPSESVLIHEAMKAGANVAVRDHGDQISGPFMHHPGDDDSAAITFWGKQDLRDIMKIALLKLDQHYGEEQGYDDLEEGIE